MMEVDVLIIGAGMAGLSLGTKLSRANKNFLIVEKSRGLGGRIATRRIQDESVDHGAPYMKPHPVIFDLLKELGFHGGKIATEGVYVENGMTSLPKKMAAHLPVKKEEKIIHLEKSNDHWTAFSENGNKYQAKTVVLTAPLPQAIELLKKSKIPVTDDLNSISYEKGILGLFLTNEEVLIKSSLPENVHSVLSMKNRSKNPLAYVLRTSANFAEENFEHSNDSNLMKIEAMFAECCEKAPGLEHSEIKKWRYVVPQSVLPDPYREVSEGLYLVGDAFQFPDLRGALLGAKELAQKLI